MSALARWCFRHRRIVLASWILALVLCSVLAKTAGSNYQNKFTLPNTPSQSAYDLLKAEFPAVSGETDQIVLDATTGHLSDPAIRSRVTAMLDKVAGLRDVKAVISPYSPRGAAQVSRDGTIAFANVAMTQQSNLLPMSDFTKIIDVARAADGKGLQVSLAGQGIENATAKFKSTGEIVGILAAFVIMIFVFGGAIFPALMPLMTALIAIGIGTSIVGLLTHLFTVATFATQLSILIGLGVGVDYALFITTRHRTGVRGGRSFEDAAVAAVNTSGRAVLFAAITVCIALLGQFALGVSLLYGVALSAAFVVALTMLTALTLLPAMFGFLGPKVLGRKERRALADSGPVPEDTRGFWLRWAKGIEGKSAPLALLGLVVVVALGLPIFGLRLGNSDAGNDPVAQTTRQAYDLLSKGFGPGFNGPFTFAGRLSSPADLVAFNRVLTAVGHTPGIVAVGPAIPSQTGKAAVATVYPSTSPQAVQTVTLINLLRNKVVPRAATGSNLAVYIGGPTAGSIDFTHVLGSKFPLFVGIVVVLAFLLLMAVFRSIVIPLTASIMNLLAVGAALGILNAVVGWGWLQSVFGFDRTGPVEAFIPVLMFSILFGLSMDYEVFLVSRMHEEWTLTHDNRQAVTRGQAESGRVITAAAAIMVLVFAAFIPGGPRVIKEFGLGLAGSVLIDAFVIRTLLVPSLMHLFGKSNWWLPAGLERVLPRLAVDPSDIADAGFPDEPVGAGSTRAR